MYHIDHIFVCYYLALKLSQEQSSSEELYQLSSPVTTVKKETWSKNLDNRELPIVNKDNQSKHEVENFNLSENNESISIFHEMDNKIEFIFDYIN